MMIVKTSVAPAGAKGLGVFADESIKKGQVVWRYEEVFCRSFPDEQVQAMEPLQREFMLKYSTPEDGFWYLDLDNTRFMNHSDDNNVDFTDGWEPGVTVGIAQRDIAIGEEMTCDYRNLNVEPIFEGPKSCQS